MEGLLASVVLIAVMLGVLLVVVFDVFCLLRLGTADTAHLVPRFVWAVLIVGTSPIGGLVYLLAQRLRKRSPEPVTISSCSSRARRRAALESGKNSRPGEISDPERRAISGPRAMFRIHCATTPPGSEGS
jgi:hypothetical protein